MVMKRSPDNMKGSVFFLVLITTALITIAMLAFLKDQGRSLALMSGVLGTGRAQQQESRALVLRFKELCQQDLSRLSCVSGKSVGSNEFSYQPKLCAFCYHAPLGLGGRGAAGSDFQHRSYFPLLNYRALFAEAPECQTEFRSALELYNLKSNYGFPLSSSAAISGKTCSVPLISSAGLKVRGNLEFLALPVLDLPGERVTAEVLTIAATGYIDSPAALYTNRSINLIAGGDIHLKYLEISGADTPPTITIFSATGVVVIDQLVGDCRIAAQSWLGVYLPQDRRNQTFLPQLAPLPVLPVGIM